jgi:hypothetical protein
MPLTVVLAVGLDSWLLVTHTRVWRSAGYIVVSACSIREAIDQFNAGDFDLVVLGDSISIENRQRLISLIHASGSLTPVACIGNSSADYDSLSDAPPKDDSNTLVTGLTDLIAKESKMLVAPAILHGGVSHR